MSDFLSGSSAGAADRTRFQLVNATPTALLGLFIAALVASGAYGRKTASPAGLVHTVSQDPGWAAFIGFAILVGGLILRPFQIALVHVLEGYWGDWILVRFLAAVCVERHRRRLDTMKIQALAIDPGLDPDPLDLSLETAVKTARMRRRVGRIKGHAARLVLAYPKARKEGLDDRLLPTMLGNLLRKAEDTAGDRYGLDMPTVYERMYPAVAAGRLGPVISQNLDVIDTASALCVMTAVATAVSLPLMTRLDWWSCIPLATALLSVTCYKGAQNAARRHAKHLATAFDLHRFDLITALHWKLPKDPQEEFTLNQELSKFLAMREPLKDFSPLLDSRPFVHPIATESSPANRDTSA